MSTRSIRGARQCVHGIGGGRVAEKIAASFGVEDISFFTETQTARETSRLHALSCVTVQAIWQLIAPRCATGVWCAGWLRARQKTKQEEERKGF